MHSVPVPINVRCYPIATFSTGKVEMWRGDCRLNSSVAAPFDWRCLSGSTMAPFPHPAHRTGRQISRIRLSDKTSRLAFARNANNELETAARRSQCSVADGIQVDHNHQLAGSLFRPRSTKVGRTELKRESAELKADDKGEHEELTAIYVDRGLDPSLAKQVAEQLMAHDALGAHARDELGISETLHARPIQAALASASSFAVGAAAPLLVTAIAPTAIYDYLRRSSGRSRALHHQL